jgi:hypothetical protein
MPLSRGFSSHRLIAYPTGPAQINKQKKKKYDVWDIMKSNSNGKLDVNVLVLGYRMEMMKIWNFFHVSE